MRTRDHWRLIAAIFKGSWLAGLIAFVSFAIGILGFIFTVVLTPSQQTAFSAVVREMLAYWYWFVIAGLVLLITVLYRRLVPSVDIHFRSDGRFILKNGAVTRFRLDCVPQGGQQERAVFRLESIRREGGDFLPIERRGLQREAGRGPMPLREPKFGYIAEFDPSAESPKIMILTVSDKASDYRDDPIPLDPSVKWLVVVSLNPGVGASCQRCFRIWVDEQNELRMAEA